MTTSAIDLLRRLGDVLDGHRWDELPDLLHDDLVADYVHTGETFGKDAFCRLNADYPGFERFTWLDLVDAGERAVGLAHVTGRGEDGTEELYAVASVATERDGLIGALTEVWTDVQPNPPEGRRPSEV